MDFNLVQKIEIGDAKKLEEGRLPKSVKSDFEAITVVPWGKDNDLLIFGSGTGKKRDLLVRGDFDEDKTRVKTYSLQKLYSICRK